MSRLFGLAILLAVVASPLMPRAILAQDATPCPPLTEEEATAFVTALTAAWNAHDTDAIVALNAPEAIHHWGIGVDSEGLEEIATAQDALFTAFPGIHVTIEQVWLSGDDTVIVRYISIGNQEAEFMGIPPSRETVTWSGIIIFQLDCGKIVEAWGEADHFGRIQQQGALPVTAPDAEATPAA
jgi:steroid delta-isomerase-like uncharacterized protein